MLKLYDFETLKFKGVIENFISVSWQMDYNSASDCTIQTTIIDSNDYQLHDIIYDSELDDACFIEQIHFEDDKVKIIAVGLSELLKYRISLENREYKGKIKPLIDSLFLNFQTRNLPNLTKGTYDFSDKNIQFNIKNDDIFSLFEQISTQNDIGFKVFFTKNKQFQLNFYEGINRSKDQNKVKKLILSKKFDNVLKTFFTVSIKNHKTVAYIKDESKNVQKIINDQLTFYERKEVYKSVSHQEGDINQFLLNEGNLELLNHRSIKELKVEINPMRLIYGKDFKLGDLATIVEEDFNLTKNVRIVGFNYVISKGEKRCGIILE